MKIPIRPPPPTSLFFSFLAPGSPALISMRGNQSHLKTLGDSLQPSSLLPLGFLAREMSRRRGYFALELRLDAGIAGRGEPGDLCRAPAAKRGVGRRPLRKALEVIEARCSDDISSPPRCRRRAARPILRPLPSPKYRSLRSRIERVKSDFSSAFPLGVVVCNKYVCICV